MANRVACSPISRHIVLSSLSTSTMVNFYVLVAMGKHLDGIDIT